MVVMGKLTSKLQKKQSETTTWENQVVRFTDSKKVNVDFCLTEFSGTKNISWNCHVDNSTYSRYNKILGRDVLNALVPNLNFSKNNTIGGEGPYYGCLSPMVGGSNYKFKILTGK